MNTFADYEAWKAKRQAAGVGAASVVIGAQDQSPDQLAGDLNLANEFGKVTGNPVPPVPMVGEYRSVFQAAIEKKRAETILSSSPRLTEWLRNPENAGVARDDLEGLSWWETGLGATWNATKRGAMRAGPQAANQYLANSGERIAADQNRSFGEILQDARDPIMVDGNEVGRAWVGPSALAGAAYRWLNSRTVPTTAEGTISGAAVFQQRAGSVAKRIEQIPMSPGGEAGKLRFMEAAKAEGWQAQLSAIGKAFTEAPGEMTSFLLQTAAESLPSMAAAAGVGVATRNPGAAAAVMGGTSFVAEYGSAPVEFFKEKGIDVSTPEGAMSAIRNPELMREAEQRGMTRGMIIGVLDGLSGGIAGTKLAESALGNMVLQSITQAAFGAGGEAGAQVASGQEFNIAEVVLEGLAEFVTAPVEVGSMAVSNLRDMQVRARDAEARVGLFQELSGQAVNSKLRGRMPDRFRQFVEQATENGPVENVFVPAQDFVEYFQSVGVDPFDLVNELDGVTRDDLDAALAGGGDLRIPTATYAAKIAGSEHDAFLMENMRFDPMEMTAREAAEFNARVDDVMQEMWAEAEDVRLEDEKWRAVEAKIYDDMVSRLRMAGRSTEVATTEAMIYPAFYRVMAERSGLSTEEFLERYPLPQVQGAIPQGLQQKNVDDLTRTLATLRARTKKTETTTPLLEWIDKRGGIDDIGGELAARNAAEIKRGRGKKTLRLARKLTEDRKPILSDVERKGGARFGWDDVAAAAVEQGFMADNPVVLEWKDAMLKGDRVAPDLVPALMDEIDRELAGQGGEVDPQEADFDAMEEYLSRLGVSLDDSDDAIRAAIETAASDDARMYGQDGQIATESDAFKAWFGGSKVVNDDGSPRVVYHGTAADFEAFSPSKIGTGGDSGFLGSGFYFGNNSYIARSYSMMRAGGNERVIEAYLSLQNPFMWGAKGLGVRGFVQEGDRLPDAIHDEVVRRTGITGRVRGDDIAFAEKQASRAVREILEEMGYDGVIATDDFSDRPIEFVAFAPTQIKSVFNRGTFDPADPRILYQRGAHPFAGFTRGQFLGNPKITSDSNASTLKPRAFQSLDDVEAVPFAAGRGLVAKYDDASAAVFDGDKVIASYNFGDTLVVDKKYRRKGIGEELVYQWRMRNPQAKTATHRTKASQALQEKVWDRVQSEISADRSYNQSASAGSTLDGLLASVRENMARKASLSADLAAAGRPVMFSTADGRRAMAGPDMSKPGGFRLTYLGADGQPSGHSEFATLAEAIRRALDEGMEPSVGGVRLLFQDYRMDHRAPDAESGAPAHDVTGDFYPDDFYSAAGFRYYGDFGKPYDRKTYDIVKKLRGKPDAMVTIYRAVPKGVSKINPGDWVGITREYAVDHGDANLGGEYDILTMQVPARDIYTNGDSLDEWGWSPDGKTYFQRAEGPRGQISVTADGKSTIRLFESANLSTMLHESGHFFLLVMQDLAAKGEANAASEYEAVKGWWRENAKAVAADGNRAMPDAKLTAEDVQRAIDMGSTGDVMKDAAVDVGMQEQWARAFEAYLMEGNAPSIELRSAFEKFRAWLISVYKRLTGLNVKMSDDIRQVFDRMLASDAEIEKAKRSSGDTGSVFASAEQMGLTPQEYDWFLKLRAQAEDDAKARLMSEVMEPIKREADKAYRAEKEKVRAEVERNINASPVYRAWEWMGNRRWLGEGQPPNLPDMRMSKDVLVERYGAGVLKTLPRGMQTIYSVDGGLDPDDAAGWFGFDSGDQMIKALERAPKRGDAIKAETDRVMNERHNDPLTDGDIEQRALDAVHGDKRGEWIAAELKAVADVAEVDVSLTAKDARASARQTIARMRVRDAVAAQRFLAAERKAGEEAARLGAMLARENIWTQAAQRRIASKAKGALSGAGSVDAVAGQIEAANASTLRRNETVQRFIAAKRRQLMNHALYMEARAVADEVAKAERFIQKLTKASTREKIAGAGRRENAQTDYLAAIDEVMDRYDFRRLSGRAEDRRGALLAYVEAMKAQGRENQLAIPEKVLQDAGRKPYKTLSVEELRGVIDTLKNVEHTALRWNDLIDAINKRKLDDAVAEVTAAFDQNMPKRPPGRVATTGEAVRNSVRQFLDLVLNAGTILREIDGFKDMGAAYRNLKAPIDEAMDRLTVRKEKAATDLEALYAVYPKEERRRMAVREHIPALGYALSKWERIAVALNTGNEGNMQRLTDERVRGSLTPDQVAEVLKTLDERDADFIQSVWDYVGSFRDDIAARERRTTGVEPAWVDAKPVVIGGKTLRGGYYPLKYDPRLSTLARDDEAQAIGEALQAGRFGKAQTKRGHLEARAKSSGRDVELDMSVLHRHVNQVIYDLELSEPVANSWKVLQSGGVRQAFMDAGRQADFDALETWLKDVAEGQISAGDWVNRNARRFKSNFTAAKLAFNLGTVMAQVTGLSQTMIVVGKRDFLRGLQASFRPGIADEIAAKSAFMRQRQTTFNKDIADFYNDPKLGPYASRWGDIKREWIGPASFWLMTKVQWFTVDIPTWLAGYQQGLRKYGGDEAKAIAHADAIVKRAQASGLFSDRSAIERGSLSRTTRQNDVVRLFTTLGSYMFAKFNVAYERTMVAGRAIRDEGVSLKAAQEAASWALDVAFLFALEAVVMAAIKGKLPDDEDDEDEGWAKFLAKETAMSILGTIPFVRDVASVGSGFEGGGAYGGITAEVAKPFQEIGQGEIDKGFVKSVISGTGLFLGLPATQINRAVDAGWRAAEGEDVSPLEYLLGKRGK